MTKAKWLYLIFCIFSQRHKKTIYIGGPGRFGQNFRLTQYDIIQLTTIIQPYKLLKLLGTCC